MIHLIGVNHRAQRRMRGKGVTDCQREFQALVESSIKSIHFDLLAEEDHPDFLSGPDVSSEKVADSILLETAKAHGIEDRHRFVDPSRVERKRIGYDVSRCISKSVQGVAHLIVCHYPKREEFWLRKIQSSLRNDVLFVCGGGHIESFTTLLARENANYRVLKDRIGALPCEIKLHEEARKYIRDNPAEFKNPNCTRMR